MCVCMCNLIILYMCVCQYIMGRKVFDFRSKTKQSFNKFFFLLNRRNVVHRYNYQTATPTSQKGIPFLIFIDNVVLRIQKHFIRFKRPNIFLIASIFCGDIIMLFTNKRWTVLSSHSLTSGLLMIILKSFHINKWSFSLLKKLKRHYTLEILNSFANAANIFTLKFQQYDSEIIYTYCFESRQNQTFWVSNIFLRIRSRFSRLQFI